MPVASFTVTKLRWLAEHEPDLRPAGDPGAAAARLADPRAGRRGRRRPPTGATRPAPATGRRPTGEYRPDLLRLGLRPGPRAAPGRRAGRAGRAGPPTGAVLGPGTGDNMAAALGLGAVTGDVVVSIGTSGTAFAVSEAPTADADRRGGRVRRRHRPVPAAGRHAQRGPGADRDRRPARRGPGPAGRAGAVRRRTAAGWCCCRTWTASAPRTCPAARGLLYGLTPGQRDAGAPGPGRGRGAALRAGRRRRRAARPGRAGSSGRC